MPDQDRRQPLGGISKETYVHHGGNEITYELISGMKSDLCHEIRKIKKTADEIKDNMLCNVDSCKKVFVTRKQVYIVVGIIGAFLIGLGIISVYDLEKIIKLFA